MTARVIPFRFHSHEVRTLLINHEPWFVAADICGVLGIVNHRDALAKLDDDEKGVGSADTLGGIQKMAVVNESGLYTLILRCRDAVKSGSAPHQFRKWVTAEVLPSIRKYGQYQDDSNKLGTLIGQTIGTDGFHILGNLVAGKVRKLPPKVQRSARMKIWSQLHTAYGVKSAEDIPAEYLDGARQFIAAYAIEGEYLPFQSGDLAQNSVSVERSVAYGLVTHAYQAAELLLEVEKGLRDFSSPLADQAISQAEGLRMFAGVIKGQNGAQFEAARVQQERMRASLGSPRALN